VNVDANATDPVTQPQPLSRPEVSERVAEVVARLGSLAKVEEPLGVRTTYRVGGAARVLVTAHSADDVVAAGQAAIEARLPVLVVGNGSNLLVADAGFDGVAVVLGEEFFDISRANTASGPQIVAGAAVALPVLARRSVALGLAGLEWMVGVPGTVGGGVRMNAGGHGADMITTLVGVTIADVAAGRVIERDAAELGLRFRGSTLKSTDVVLSASFRASVPPMADAGHGGPTGEKLLTDIVRWRRENQPGGQNAGSVFVNPYDGADSAGRLVDEAGLKGLRHKSAQVSPKHANFIQADQGGSADDVLELMRIVADKVHSLHGIKLRSEVRLVGFNTTEFQTEHSEDRQ